MCERMPHGWLSYPRRHVLPNDRRTTKNAGDKERLHVIAGIVGSMAAKKLNTQSNHHTVFGKPQWTCKYLRSRPTMNEINSLRVFIPNFLVPKNYHGFFIGLAMAHGKGWTHDRPEGVTPTYAKGSRIRNGVLDLPCYTVDSIRNHMKDNEFIL